MKWETAIPVMIAIWHLELNIVHSQPGLGVPAMAQRVKNPAGAEVWVGLIPGLAQWVKGSSDATHSCA